MSASSVEIELLLSGVNAKLAAIRSFEDAYGAELALNFDPISDFWGLYENASSLILTYFLNPLQRHGQGDRFLRSFVNHVCPPSVAARLARVRPTNVQPEFTIPTKKANDTGRIDIVVQYDQKPKFCIAVENKLGTPDGPGQIDRYTNYLQGNYKTIDGELGHVLVYLTPGGGMPSSYSMNDREAKLDRGDGEFKCLSWTGDLLRLLDEWRRLCQSDHVRWFLKSFERALRNKLGIMEMNEQNQVVDKIMKTNGGVTAALAVGGAIDVLKDKLWDKFVEDWRIFGAEKGWELKQVNDRWQDFAIVFYSPKWHDAAIAIRSQDGAIYAGISHHKVAGDFEGLDAKSEFLAKLGQREDFEVKSAELAKVGQLDEPNDYWPVCMYLPKPYGNLNQPEVWSDIQTGSNSGFYKLLAETLTICSQLLDMAM